MAEASKFTLGINHFSYDARGLVNEPESPLPAITAANEGEIAIVDSTGKWVLTGKKLVFNNDNTVTWTTT